MKIDFALSILVLQCLAPLTSVVQAQDESACGPRPPFEGLQCVDGIWQTGPVSLCQGAIDHLTTCALSECGDDAECGQAYQAAIATFSSCGTSQQAMAMSLPNLGCASVTVLVEEGDNCATELIARGELCAATVCAADPTGTPCADLQQFLSGGSIRSMLESSGCEPVPLGYASSYLEHCDP